MKPNGETLKCSHMSLASMDPTQRQMLRLALSQHTNTLHRLERAPMAMAFLPWVSNIGRSMCGSRCCSGFWSFCRLRRMWQTPLGVQLLAPHCWLTQGCPPTTWAWQIHWRDQPQRLRAKTDNGWSALRCTQDAGHFANSNSNSSSWKVQPEEIYRGPDHRALDYKEASEGPRAAKRAELRPVTSEQRTASQAPAYRALAASANDLAKDLPDSSHATKEPRGCFQPTRTVVERLQRRVRYVVGKPRRRWRFASQEKKVTAVRPVWMRTLQGALSPGGLPSAVLLSEDSIIRRTGRLLNKLSHYHLQTQSFAASARAHLLGWGYRPWLDLGLAWSPELFADASAAIWGLQVAGVRQHPPPRHLRPLDTRAP